MDYGFEAAGFQTIVGIEMDAYAVATARANRSWQIIDRDIKEVRSEELLHRAGLARGEPALLIGGPPCQPFSKAGYWSRGYAGRLSDPRSRTLDEFVRVVRETLPQAFVLENVHGINYSGKEEGMLLLRRLVEDINTSEGTTYRLSWAVLNAADFGVPQLRTRFFLVGDREGRGFTFPLPTHGRPGHHSLPSYSTAWDAIGGLTVDSTEDLRIRGKWADLVPSIPEGENYLWHTDRKGGLPLFGWRTRYWSFLLKLSKDKPSWTIQAQSGPATGPFHWENRRLSIREMARIQTIPDDVDFVGSRNAIQRQIGNAVPSLLAEAIGREIARQLFDISIDGAARLGVTPRRPIPRKEKPSAVPMKYMHLVGNYDAHPGPGRGPMAGARAQSDERELIETT